MWRARYWCSSRLLQELTSWGKTFWPSLPGCVSSVAFRSCLLFFSLLYLVPNHPDIPCHLRGPVTQGKQAARRDSSSKAFLHEEVKLFPVSSKFWCDQGSHMGVLSQSSAEPLHINQVWSKSPFASSLGHSTTCLSLQAGCKYKPSGGAEPQRATSPRVPMGVQAQRVTCTCCQQISFRADRYCSCVHLGAGGHALP